MGILPQLIYHYHSKALGILALCFSLIRLANVPCALYDA